MGYTFISYSRKQLYFAEAIALSLQKQGIETWFDLQQLEPGTDWDIALKNGYENCERLVFVASKAALSSPYVTFEWETALRNGKEVILAVVEDIEIPEKLMGCAIYDFRIKFNKPISLLTDYLKGKVKPQYAKIPKPTAFRFPIHMPVMIWLILIVLIMPALTSVIVSAGIFISESKIYSLFFLAFMIPVIRWALTFWTHSMDYMRLRQQVLLSLMFQLLPGLFIFIMPALGKLFSNLPIAGLFLTIIVYLSLGNSGALLRWFSAGQVPQELRIKHHKKLLKEGEGNEFLQEVDSWTATSKLGNTSKIPPIAFYLHFDPADKPIADQILKSLQARGHLLQSDLQQAQKQILIVTNKTSKKLIQWISDTYNSDAIFMLGTPINFAGIPPGAAKSQWVDWREFGSGKLNALANVLSIDEASRKRYGLETTPTNFEDLPVAVFFFGATFMYQVGSFLGSGFSEYLLGLGNLSWTLPGLLLQGEIKYFINGFDFLIQGILYIILGLCLFVGVERTIMRRITFLPAFLLVPGIFLFYGLIMIIMDGVKWIGYLLFPVLAFYATHRFWYPIKTSDAEDPIGFNSKIHGLFRFILLGAGVFAFIGTFVKIIFNL